MANLTSLISRPSSEYNDGIIKPAEDGSELDTFEAPQCFEVPWSPPQNANRPVPEHELRENCRLRSVRVIPSIAGC